MCTLASDAELLSRTQSAGQTRAHDLLPHRPAGPAHHRLRAVPRGQRAPAAVAGAQHLCPAPTCTSVPTHGRRGFACCTAFSHHGAVDSFTNPIICVVVQTCEDVIRWVPDLLPVAPKLQRSSASLNRRSERALLRTTTCEASPALQQFLALYGSGSSGRHCAAVMSCVCIVVHRALQPASFAA